MHSINQLCLSYLWVVQCFFCVYRLAFWCSLTSTKINTLNWWPISANLKLIVLRFVESQANEYEDIPRLCMQQNKACTFYLITKMLSDKTANIRPNKAISVRLFSPSKSGFFFLASKAIRNNKKCEFSHNYIIGTENENVEQFGDQSKKKIAFEFGCSNWVVNKIGSFSAS